MKSTISELKEELISESPNEQLIKSIIENPDAGEEFVSEAFKDKDDPKKNLKFIYLSIISGLFLLKISEISRLKSVFSLDEDEVTEVAGLAFLFAEKQKNYDVMLYIIENFDLIDKSLVKPLIELIKALILSKEYEKAVDIWNKYNKFIINDKPIFEALEKAYKRSMNFKKENLVRDYSDTFNIIRLFKLPKDITFQKAVDEFNFNFNQKRFYTAALIGKNLKLGEAITKKAAYEAFKKEIERFRKNLEKGIYKEWKKIDVNDPFFKARKILSEFGVYDVNIEKNSKEYDLVRKVAEIVYEIFEILLNEKLYNDIGLISKTHLAIKMIKDYALNNDRLLPHVFKNVVIQSEKLTKNIDGEVIDYKSGMEYYELLKSLRELNVLNYEKTDIIAQKIFIFALKRKEIKTAIRTYMEFSFNFDSVKNDVLEIIYEWAKNNDFDDILILMDKFPIKDSIIRDEQFMDRIEDYYYKNLKENKLLKCLNIAEAFNFNRTQYIDSLKGLIIFNLKSKKITETKNLMKKFKMKKNEISEGIKEYYFEVLKTDKNYARKLRTEFDLSIFDVGFLKWFLYEVIGLKLK